LEYINKIKMNFNKIISQLAIPAFLIIVFVSILFSFYKYVVLKDFMYEIPKDGNMPEITE